MVNYCVHNKDPAKGVFSIVHSYFETLGKYLLFTKYLTSTNNMPTIKSKQLKINCLQW